MYDLIIIGAGPAGLSAAIYASRARLNAIVIEQNYVNGGQIIDTYEIDNYPGLPGLSGMDLAMKMAEHAEKLGVETVNGFVQSLDLTRTASSARRARISTAGWAFPTARPVTALSTGARMSW